MSETITAINEITDAVLRTETGKRLDGSTYSRDTTGDGFEVITDKQRIVLGIDNGQSCCENWGYFMSEDDVQAFIGAELLGVTLTDTALNTTKFREHLEWGVDDGGVMFVNIETSRGVLQFVAYNAHNGYYGHSAYVASAQLTHEETL